MKERHGQKCADLGGRQSARQLASGWLAANPTSPHTTSDPTKAYLFQGHRQRDGPDARASIGTGFRSLSGRGDTSQPAAEHAERVDG